MTRSAQIAYAIAGACFAATLAMADKPDWWSSHPIIAVMLGFSIPSCVLGAWMSETRIRERKVLGIRFIPYVTEAMVIAAWCGIGIGLVALALFLFTFSRFVAYGFCLGGFVLGFFAEFREHQSKQQQQIKSDEK
jgi:hypothetical protein